MTCQRLVFFFACAWGLAAVVRAQDAPRKDDVKIIPVKGAYGTLIYDGVFERRTGGDAYEYLLKELKLKYDPAAKTNRVPEIVGLSIELSSGKKPAAGETRGTSLYQDRKPVSFVVSEDSPTATVKDLTFYVPKDAIDKADHVHLTVLDGRLGWPLRISERPPAQQSGDGSKTDAETYQPKGEYGTLLYEGTVERKVAGKDYEYLVRELKLTFNPRGKSNKTTKIETRFIEFVATVQSPKAKTKVETLFQEKKPLSVVLNQKSPTDTVENIKFTVPRESIQKADSAFLNITDGKLVWPIRLVEEPKATGGK